MTTVALELGYLAEGDEWAVAELAARSGLEPELASRFAADPDTVCAEFGLAGPELRRLAAAFTAPAPLERLDRAEGTARWCPWCVCTVAPGSDQASPEPAAQASTRVAETV